jgi:hypothetical protein
MLDKRLWRGYERTIADTVAYPGCQTWWATRKHWYTDEFCALIDGHIQTAKPTIYDDYNYPRQISSSDCVGSFRKFIYAKFVEPISGRYPTRECLAL